MKRVPRLSRACMFPQRTQGKKRFLLAAKKCVLLGSYEGPAEEAVF